MSSNGAAKGLGAGLNARQVKEKLIRETENVRKRLLELRGHTPKVKSTEKAMTLVSEITEQTVEGLNSLTQGTIKSLDLSLAATDAANSALGSVNTVQENALLTDDRIETLETDTTKMMDQLEEVKQAGLKTQKELKRNVGKTDMALSISQRRELEESSRWLIIKNVPLALDESGKEDTRARFNLAYRLFEEFSITEWVQVTGAQRLQKRKGVPDSIIPNLRIQLGGEGMRKIVLEAVDKAHRTGHLTNYIFQADVPAYAKKKFKEMNALAKVCRDLSKGRTKTKIGMKANWPHVFTKDEFDNRYTPATDEQMEKFRSANKESRESLKRKAPQTEDDSMQHSGLKTANLTASGSGGAQVAGPSAFEQN